ncbi:auxin-induced protein 22B [Andrographis paniculata]|uniref:auxin-induced protein 22B n=1 Tax=Andrographis paniculata TaxID=175694 RepID=UPI0021E7B5F6|nr:auxin-induced protein 22B [Andrographis paniculata]
MGSINKIHESDLNLKATELRLGLPGTDETDKINSGCKNNNNNNKRAAPEESESSSNSATKSIDHGTAPAPKAQIVGWPPVKNSFQAKKGESESGMYVKVSMDGAPYLRKIDLKIYSGYPQLLKALETMFKLTIGEYSEREGYKGSEYAPAYQDKDGDLMLVGDVPWDMFMSSCRRLRIMKGPEARGLGGCVL